MKRYERFCRSIQSLQRVKQTNDGLETHHILPKSMSVGNDPENLVVMTIREHFIAHLLLWLACDRAINQARMVIMMLPDSREATPSKSLLHIKSRFVEQFRTKLYESLKGMVHVTSKETGEKVTITSEEYQTNKHLYKYANSGKVTVYDVAESKYVSIPVDLYYEDDNTRYLWIERENIQQRYIHPETLDEIKCKPNEQPQGYIHWNSYHAKGKSCDWLVGTTPVYDVETMETTKVSSEEYKRLRSLDPSRYVHPTQKKGVPRKGPPSGVVNAFLINEQRTITVTSEEFSKRNNVDLVHASRKKQFLIEEIK
jgi:hypothetical protein